MGPVVRLLFRVAVVTIRTEEGAAGGGDGEPPEVPGDVTNAERRDIMLEIVKTNDNVSETYIYIFIFFLL